MKLPLGCLTGRRIGLVFALVLSIFIISYSLYPRDEVEIALVIGEPWRNMQERSTAKIGEPLAGRNWYQIPKTDARLRLADMQYGFVTPMARFFAVSYIEDGTIRNVRMSPQIESLLLDDTLQVLLNLQDQWSSSGWKLAHDDFPAIEDTLYWRTALRENRAEATYWVAGDKYQVMLFASRFFDPKWPDEERYLITLQLAPPMWVD